MGSTILKVHFAWKTHCMRHHARFVSCKTSRCTGRNPKMVPNTSHECCKLVPRRLPSTSCVGIGSEGLTLTASDDVIEARSSLPPKSVEVWHSSMTARLQPHRSRRQDDGHYRNLGTILAGTEAWRMQQDAARTSYSLTQRPTETTQTPRPRASTRTTHSSHPLLDDRSTPPTLRSTLGDDRPAPQHQARLSWDVTQAPRKRPRHSHSQVAR